MSLRCRVLHHRHHESAGRVGGESHVDEPAHDEIGAVGIERRIEARELLQRLDAGPHDEGERRQLDAGRVCLVLQARAQLLEIGDIGLVELRDVRNVDPGRLQARTRDLLDAGERLRLDRSVLRVVDHGNRGQRRAGTRGGCARRSCSSGGRRKRALHERLDVLMGDAALEPRALDAREIDAELARELPYRGAGVGARETRLVDGREVRPIGGRCSELRE